MGQLLTAFAFDWEFSTGEKLAGEAWQMTAVAAGGIAARGVSDGPDEDFETILLVLLGAITQAERCVRIVTPYYPPDPPLMEALRVATLRGVRVDLVLPGRGNLRLVDLAMAPQLPRLVAWGCHVYGLRRHSTTRSSSSLTAHGHSSDRRTGIRAASDSTSSTTWSVSSRFAEQLDGIIEGRIALSRSVTLEELRQRSLALRVRDGVVRLAHPYL